MPDNPSTPGSNAIQRARERMRGMGQGIGNFARDRMQGVMNAIPGTAGHDWRQTFDAATNSVLPLDLFDSQSRTWNNPMQWFGLGRNRQAGAPLPSYLQPGAIQPQTPQGYQAPALPGTLPQGQGPLMSHQNNPLPARASPSSGAGRMGGTTVATGEGAQNIARSFAPTGTRSTSYGREELMRSNRAN